MLFNSYEFIFLYLPFALLVFFQLGRVNHAYASSWLALASLIFYAYWNPTYVGLLLGSIIFNYTLGLWIAKAGLRQDAGRKKHLLIIAVTVNLLLLTYFKYFNFFVGGVNSIVGSQWSLGNIILPLGISFFTFTQIAFLVDTSRGVAKEYSFNHYCLFVTYFPHLIAGPILHHKEMMPQFADRRVYHFNSGDFLAGLTIFTIGLVKKTGVADELAPFANAVFASAENGSTLTLLQAWAGSLAYTFQIYFDFSGYSDMAIGLARMTGIVLPLNFNSPYKAVNIIDFWRRWHMTLSRFLRDYLYFSLGGNKKGMARRHFNLMITMLLGGLWHGAGWTFVIWGGLHGVYLTINHGWQALAGGSKWQGNSARSLSRVLTFLTVVVAWVFFRADHIQTANSILMAMAGGNGLSLPASLAGILGGLTPILESMGIRFESSNYVPLLIAELLLLSFVWFAPNTQEMMAESRSAYDSPRADQPKVPNWLRWRPNFAWTLVTGLFFGYSILTLSRVTEFIYFNF
jgi:D-alanyl-lipoteichoic acid acyltransferase DltB (MBOAT superfamily)